jgi:hypothetical protein
MTSFFERFCFVFSPKLGLSRIFTRGFIKTRSVLTVNYSVQLITVLFRFVLRHLWVLSCCSASFSTLISFVTGWIPRGYSSPISEAARRSAWAPTWRCGKCGAASGCPRLTCSPSAWRITSGRWAPRVPAVLAPRSDRFLGYLLAIVGGNMELMVIIIFSFVVSF